MLARLLPGTIDATSFADFWASCEAPDAATAASDDDKDADAVDAAAVCAALLSERAPPFGSAMEVNPAAPVAAERKRTNRPKVTTSSMTRSALYSDVYPCLT